jgi:structure-specific recognition protein 1
MFHLQFNNQGLIHEVFTTVLRGLSGAKVTKPGKFRSCQDGYAVKSSLKAEDGILYPLEKSFFFLPKPPTLITHEEVKFEFCLLTIIY